MKDCTPTRKTIRLVAMLLTVATLIVSLPLTVFAKQTEREQQILSPSDVPEQLEYDALEEQGYIQRLYEEEQDLYSYLFGKEDGSKTRIFYQYPVKYIDEEGKIRDKSLNLAAQTVDGSEQYVSRDSDIAVTFHDTLSKGIELNYREIALSMRPEIAESYSSLANGTLSEDSRRVRYLLDEYTYIDYALTYTGVKEDIVVSEYTGCTAYSFLLHTDGLSVLSLGENEYALADETGAIQAYLGDVLIFTADERNNTFGEMKVETVQENELYRLTVQVDADWLADEKTVYPITIDPTISVTVDDTTYGKIEDVVIGTSTTYSGTSGSLYTGRGSSGATIRSLMRFPNLDLSGKIVTDASVELRDLMCQDESIEIECHEYVGNSWSEAGSTSWSSVGSYTVGKLLDSHYVCYGNGNVNGQINRYSFDITTLAKAWAAGDSDPSKGILFKATDTFESGSNNTFKTFASINRAEYQPTLSVTYSEAVGLNGSYEYDTQTLGDNITIYNNIPYGGLVAEYKFDVPKGNFPIQPSYVYNSTYATEDFFDHYGIDSTVYGRFVQGWKLNLVELIQKQGSGYLYVDGYGTEYYLTYNADKDQYTLDEIGAALTVNSDGTFTLDTDDGMSRKFHANGLIASLTSDKKTYDYQYTNNRLSGIKYNGDSIFAFTYYDWYFQGILSFNTPDGESVTSEIPFDDGSGYMNRIVDPHGNATYIVSTSPFDLYNSIDGYGYRYTLSEGKVTGYEYYRKVNGTQYTISTTAIARSDNRITYTAGDLMTTYLLDDYNRIYNLVVSSPDGKTVYDVQMYSYAEQSDQCAASTVRGGQPNYLTSAFAGYTTDWSGNFTVSGNKALMGSHSVSLSSSDGSRKYIAQTNSLTAGSYVLSAYVQYSDLKKKTSSAAGGFTFGVTDASGNRVSTGEYYLDSLTDEEDEWVRVWIPCTIPANGNYTVTFALENAIGTVYLDCFQLEKGTTPTAYNCIRNAGFENSNDGSWNGIGSDSTNICFGDACGYVGLTDSAGQTVDLDNMSVDRSFIVSFWIKMLQAYPTEHTILSLAFNCTNGTYSTSLPADTSITGMQYIGYECQVPESYGTVQSVNLQLINSVPTNLYLDNFLLTFGSSVEEAESKQQASSGLNFVSYGNGTCYLYNIGTCTDTDIVIPETSPAGEKVIRIGSNAFNGNTSITSVTLPDTVEIIRFYAFRDCTALRSVTLGSGLTQIEERVFSGCSALEEINFPDGLTSIGDYCFDSCTSLVSAILPDSLTDLGGACFYSCTSLENVELGDGLTVLNFSIFNRCSALKSIVLPENLTEIGLYVFNHCKKLQSVQIPETLTTVKSTAFYDCAPGLTFYCTGDSSVWSGITFASDALPATYVTRFNSELIGNFVYTYTYDTKGNNVGTEIHYIGYAEDAANSDAVMFTSVVYDAQGNLLSYTDESGHTTTYTYDHYGNILTVTDASGVTTTYTYYSNGLLKSVSRSGQTNTYTYANGLLTGVTHTGTNYSQSYTYTYNNYGNLISVKAGNQTLVTYAYSDSGKGDLSSITYANGDVKSYSYDVFGNVTEIRMNGSLLATDLYDSNGSLYAHTESATGETTRYFEDEYGYAGASLTFGSNGWQIEAIAEPSVELGSTTTEDIYDRLVSKTLTANEAEIFTQNYTYVSNGYYSSYELAGESFSGGGAFTYTYNSLGYLTSVKENGILKLSYTYDDLGQLIREDNAYAGKTYVYTYDNGGNILTKKTYAYTTGTLGAVQSTVNYGYGNSDWKDQLTSYNGSTIPYDASGNPLKWRNATALTWTGRQLDSMTLTDGTNVSFQYNSDGLRVSKTVGNDTVKYRWDGTTLQAEEHSGYTITFLYDGDTLVGFNYGGNNYYYGIDNLGVIHYVYNEAGTVVITYTYDAWGNTVSATGDSTLINVNPIRYKSYYYDSETGLFYLQSRYYDPQVGRFINADEIDNLNLLSIYNLIGTNLYTYCFNQPISNSDNSGNIAILDDIAIGGFLVIVIGIVALLYISSPQGQRSWEQLCTNVIDGFKNLSNNLQKAWNKVTAVSKSIANAVTKTVSKAIDKARRQNKFDYWIAVKINFGNGYSAYIPTTGLSYNEAVSYVRAGGDIFARTSSKAKNIAKAAGNGAPPVWDAAHGGIGYRPHWHAQKVFYTHNGKRYYNRIGGHVFYF